MSVENNKELANVNFTSCVLSIVGANQNTFIENFLQETEASTVTYYAFGNIWKTDYRSLTHL